MNDIELCADCIRHIVWPIDQLRVSTEEFNIRDVTFGGSGCCLKCIVFYGVAVFKTPPACAKKDRIVQFNEIHHNYYNSNSTR